MKSEYTYQVGDEIKTVSVRRDEDCFLITIGDATYEVSAQRPEHGRLHMQVGDRRLRAYVAGDDDRRYVALDGDTWVLEQPRQKQKRRVGSAGGADAGSLEAAMPGLVLDVLVSEGDTVERGEALVLLEAMKMELRITAPAAGRVTKVYCKAGEVVDRGQVLVEIADS